MNSSSITTSPVGSSTSRAHLDARSVCGSRSSSRSVSLARSWLAGASSFATPPSSFGPIHGRAWSIHGNAASIVAGVSRTPGMISRANARVEGNASFREASARLAVVSVSGSSRTEVCRLPDSAAKAAIVALKLVISPRSAFSLRISAPVVRAVPSIRRDRSWLGSVPRKASKTCAVERSASGMSS